jgi:ZIP family zinc transporter
LDYLLVLVLAMLPAGGNIIGTVLAESMQTPKWVVGAALHAAAGIAIALVSVDLMPRILPRVEIPWLVVAFAVGTAISIVIAWIVRKLGRSQDNGKAGAWMVQAAVLVDLASDGLMTGAGAGVSFGLGVLLALAQLVANIPGGFAAAANFKHRGIKRAKRYLIAALVPLPVFVTASLGFWVLKDTDPGIQHAVLAVMVGVLLLTTVEETLPEADAPRPPRWISTSAFAAGFVGLVVLSTSFAARSAV